ncbi:MAG TPA: S-layer homology domain-containing protein [Candidatus Olsenella avicola]|nr:S-layer homology domain-containing protein [Candidatus Olsenella avicola]
MSSYAVEPMSWAVSAGVLTGKGGVALDPQGQCTRGEVAAMMMRMAQ